MIRRSIRSSAVLAAFALSASTVGAIAQEASPPPGDRAEEGAYEATIREGSCDAVGEEVALLAGLSAPEADARGEIEGAVSVSVTEVSIPLETIVEGEHVLVLEDAGSEDVLACAPLSGPIVGDGLAAALRGAGEGRLAGVAWLHALGLDATTVHVFLADDAPLGMTPARSPGPGGSPQPDDSPQPGDSPAPEPGDSPAPEPGDSPQPDGSPQPDPDGAIDPDPEIDPGEDIDVDVGD